MRDHSLETGMPIDDVGAHANEVGRYGAPRIHVSDMVRVAPSIQSAGGSKSATEDELVVRLPCQVVHDVPHPSNLGLAPAGEAVFDCHKL